MKFLYVLIISFSAMASYIPIENIGTCSTSEMYFRLNSRCQSFHGKECFSIPQDYNCAYHVFQEATWLKEQVISCADALDCESKRASLVCNSEGFEPSMNLEPLEAFCVKFSPAQVVVDAVKKASYDAAQAQKVAMENAMAAAKKAMDCGRDVKALLVVRNASKNLTPAQIKEMVTTYSEIDALLSSGSLNTAKAEILAAEADNIIITNDDKTALAAKIDECLLNN